MRIFLAFLLLSAIAATNAAHAQIRPYEKKFQPFLTRGETTWSISGGVRRNDLEWSRAADEAGNATPNVASEQTWNDILSLEVEGKVRHIEPLDISLIKGGVLLEGKVTGGVTVDGNGRLSSYLGNNRTGEFARQTFDNLTGNNIGGALAIGYQINLTGTPAYEARRVLSARRPRTSRGQKRQARALRKALHQSGPYISVTPIAGYAADQQTYYREDAYQHIPTADLPVGPFHTESEFIANWYGPFIGLEGEIKTAKNMLRLRGELHDLTYYGKGIEPSRADDLEQDPTYDHEADGEAILLNAAYAYALGKDYALTVDATYRHRETDDGVYKIYPLNAEPLTRKLNEVSDTSQALRVGFRYNW